MLVKWKNGLNDDNVKTIEISKYAGNKKRYYKAMIKHIIISDEKLFKELNSNCIRETLKGNYTIDKK